MSQRLVELARGLQRDALCVPRPAAGEPDRGRRFGARPLWLVPLLLLAIGSLGAKCTSHVVATATNDRYGAVFHPGTDAHGFQAGLSWHGLLVQFNKRGAENQRLTDVEVVTRAPALVGGPGSCEPPSFAGVWRHGLYGQSILGGLNWADFNLAAQEQLQQFGMQFVDLETHVECGVRKWVGVFKQGSALQSYQSDLSWQEFMTLFGQFHAFNWHLIDFETYEDGGQRRWAGVWQEGSKGEWIYLLPRDQFEELRDDLVGQGKELFDFESYRESNFGPEVRWVVGLFYTAPLVAGETPPPSSLFEMGETWDKFITLWDGEAQAGTRMQDLEVFPDAEDLRWKNTFASQLGVSMGHSFAVFESGRLATSGGGGFARSPSEIANPSVPMTAESVVNVASITKNFTAVGILEIAEQFGGNYSFLDVPMGIYLQADFSTFGQGVFGLGPGVYNVTIRNLLTHKTGMSNIDVMALSGATYWDKVASWVAMDLVAPSGVTATYHNDHFNLLARIIEIVKSTDYQNWMNANVFAPQGIGPLSCGPWSLTSNTRYYGIVPDTRLGKEWGSVGGDCIGGSWYATAIDLARHVAGLRYGDVLTSTTLTLMENETIAWYPYGSAYNHNGGLCETPSSGNAKGLSVDMMALDDDFDVGLMVNSATAASCGNEIALEQVILDAYQAPEDW